MALSGRPRGGIRWEGGLSTERQLERELNRLSRFTIQVLHPRQEPADTFLPFSQALRNTVELVAYKRQYAHAVISFQCEQILPFCLAFAARAEDRSLIPTYESLTPRCPL